MYNFAFILNKKLINDFLHPPDNGPFLKSCVKVKILKTNIILNENNQKYLLANE